MRLASWIVTSHHRPALLAATLEHLRETVRPPGWDMEIVVAHAADDRESADIAHRAGAVVIPTSQPHPSGKRNAASLECLGEFVMTTDDDDFQSPSRMALAVAAYTTGHKLSGIREFRRLHLATGNVVRYCGRGGEHYPHLPNVPPVFCGTARNYDRKMLREHNGWNERLPSMEDTDLHNRITRRSGSDPGIVEFDLGGELAASTIICQHEHNIFARPEISRGQVEIFGEYVIVGEGHYSELADFPPAVAQRLAAVGKL